jgi:hypothetical protein
MTDESVPEWYAAVRSLSGSGVTKRRGIGVPIAQAASRFRARKRAQIGDLVRSRNHVVIGQQEVPMSGIVEWEEDR